MKTILNILIILLAAVVIAAGFWLVVNNTSIASGPGGEGGQRPAMSGAEGTRPARPDGGEEGGASIGQGLLQVLVTLAKLAGISAVVLLIEKGISLLGRRAPQATIAQ